MLAIIQGLMSLLSAGGGGTGVGDPFFSNVSALLHFDGANGGTTFTDTTGKTWTPAGNAQTDTTTPRFGSASMLCDGTGDFIQSVTSTDFDIISAGDFTVELWFNPTNQANSDGNSLVCVGNASGYWQLLVRNNTVQVNIRNATGGAFSDLTASQTLTNGQWAHIAWTRSSGVYRLFFNGALLTTTGSLPSTFTVGSATCYVGANYNGGTSSTEGRIDELRITKGVARYTAAFTAPTEPFPDFAPVGDSFFGNVTSLLHFDGANGSTSFLDQSGKTWTGSGTSANAGLSTTDSRFGTACLLLNGGNISTPDSPDWDFGAGDFTIEAWVRPTNTSQTGAIVAQWDGGSQRAWVLYQVAGSIQFSYSTNLTGSVNAFSTAAGWSTTAYQHVAVSCVNGVIRGFVNGVQIGTDHTRAGAISNSTLALRVGNEGSGSNQFNGRVDDLRITKGVGRYTTNFTPPAAPFADAGDALFNTLDPTRISSPSIITSNGLRLTANSGGTGTYANARAVRALQGLAYFSFEVRTDAAGSVMGAGLCDASLDLTSAAQYVGIGTTSLAVWLPSGEVFVNGANIGNVGAPIANPTTIEVAVRAATRRVWVRRSGGAWVGGGDPVADTTPTATLAGTGALFPAATISRSGSTANRYAELDADLASTAGTAPSGFTAANWLP